MAEFVKRVAPYLPFRTFLNSLDALSQGVPPKLDRTFWRSQSGINQGLIWGAYKFFMLVGQNGESTHDLVDLAKFPEKRPKKMRELVELQYMVVLQKIDLTTATTKMLEQIFEDLYAVNGATKQKAIAFFLKAAKFAEMPLGPYLLTQLREAAKKPKKTRPPREPVPTNGMLRPPSTPSINFHTVHLSSGGRITIDITANPFTLPMEDRNFFFSLVDMLQKYGAEHPERQQEEIKEEEE